MGSAMGCTRHGMPAPLDERGGAGAKAGGPKAGGLYIQYPAVQPSWTWDTVGYYVPPHGFVRHDFQAGQIRTNPDNPSYSSRTYRERAWTNVNGRVCPGLGRARKWRFP